MLFGKPTAIFFSICNQPRPFINFFQQIDSLFNLKKRGLMFLKKKDLTLSL